MRLPTPQRGQPLDLSFMYDIVDSINQLWNVVGARVSALASIDTVAGKKNVKSSELKFVAGYKDVYGTETDVTAGSTKEFRYEFTTEFMYPPIVTATPITVGDKNTDASKNASVVITLVTTSRVEGVVKFDIGGKTAIGVNVLAVGVPV